MIPIKKNIYYIPVNDEFLVYSPLNSISALLNKQALVELKHCFIHMKTDMPVEGNDIQQLANDLLYFSQYKIIQNQGELNPLYLGIIPSRACNGSCSYCDFGAEGFKNDTMSHELALKTVDWYADLMQKLKRNLLEIHFFGGEPMIAPDVVGVIINRARMIAAENKIKPYFEISTNGQYSEKQAKWIGNNFNSVVLSFDGFEETQNYHRPKKGGNSYKNVLRTAKILSKSDAQLTIRCCISQHNIEQMQELTHWFCQNFNLHVLNFEILVETELTSSKSLASPSPYEFATQLFKCRQISNSYGVKLIYASDITNKPQVSSCPVGKDTIIVSPDGRISNCYMLPERWQKANLEFDFGNINHTTFIDTEALTKTREVVKNKPRCETCFCKWSCAGGCHIGNTPPGCSNQYSDYCLQTRIISACTLLNKLEMPDEMTSLINNPKALKNLACHSTDVLIDMEL